MVNKPQRTRIRPKPKPPSKKAKNAKLRYLIARHEEEELTTSWHDFGDDAKAAFDQAHPALVKDHLPKVMRGLRQASKSDPALVGLRDWAARQIIAGAITYCAAKPTTKKRKNRVQRRAAIINHELKLLLKKLDTLRTFYDRLNKETKRHLGQELLAEQDTAMQGTRRRTLLAPSQMIAGCRNAIDEQYEEISLIREKYPSRKEQNIDGAADILFREMILTWFWSTDAWPSEHLYDLLLQIVHAIDPGKAKRATLKRFTAINGKLQQDASRRAQSQGRLRIVKRYRTGASQ